MTITAELKKVNDELILECEDGTIIQKEKIGYIATCYSHNVNDCFYERMTSADIDFIIENNIKCAIQMMDEFTNPEEYVGVPLFEGERKPKLYKGKIIIHLL